MEGANLRKGSDGNAEQSVEITFPTESQDADGNVYKNDVQGDNAPDADYSASSIVYDPDTHDPRDPDSKEWNGLDPAFTNTISGDMEVYGKNKPSLGKVEKSALAFKAGTSKDLQISLLGPITELDVYIAGKDAVKFWPDKWTDKTKNIQLTSDNIKAFNIPFRVTSYDLNHSIKDTGDAKKNAKKRRTLRTGKLPKTP